MAKRRTYSRPGGPRSFFARRFASLAVVTILGILGFLLMRGRVLSVSDGDTLVVLTENNQREKVRLYGIDCPELGQAYGKEARDFTVSLALLDEVKLTRMYTDQHGRTVALVSLADGRSLNAELAANGLAMVYWRYCAIPQCAAWQALEKEARRKGLGLWADSNPESPWAWRARQAKNR